MKTLFALTNMRLKIKYNQILLSKVICILMGFVYNSKVVGLFSACNLKDIGLSVCGNGSNYNRCKKETQTAYKGTEHTLHYTLENNFKLFSIFKSLKKEQSCSITKLHHIT